MTSFCPDQTCIVITCEHASCEIPPEYAFLFAGSRKLLKTHRGYDIGALEIAEDLGRRFGTPVFSSPFSRLLVDLNRSTSSRTIFSSLTRPLPATDRDEILNRYYFPYRSSVEKHIRCLIAGQGSAFHVSLHTFTPVMHGEARNADIAFLYDPKRYRERISCSLMAKHAKNVMSDLIIRKNYPYKGVSDGFATHLRKQFPQDQYAGIEIEINQKHCLPDKARWHIIAETLAGCITHAVS